jgi:hypothetical protein
MTEWVQCRKCYRVRRARSLLGYLIPTGAWRRIYNTIALKISGFTTCERCEKAAAAVRSEPIIFCEPDNDGIPNLPTHCGGNE